MTHTKVYKLLDSNGMTYLSTTPGTFGGHRGLKIYGRLDFPSALRFIAAGKYVRHRVFFPDAVTAVAAGYRPCARCLKTRYEWWRDYRADWMRFVEECREECAKRGTPAHARVGIPKKSDIFAPNIEAAGPKQPTRRARK